jgi:hypothetical protein
MNAMATNMVRKGRSTRNHDRGVAPALQMRFKIHVHKRTTMILIAKIINVLDT